MKEYIGAMSDEEMAADRWENEGGRTSAVVKYFLLSATISLFWSRRAMAQKPCDIRIEPHTFVTNNGQKIEAEFGRIYVPEKHAKPNGKLIKLAFVRFKSTAKIPFSMRQITLAPFEFEPLAARPD